METMTSRPRTTLKKQRDADRQAPWYRGAEIPRTAIRRFARDVAEKFHPDKIILFGSHAYGRPHADSDVDILVIMPCRNELDQAYKIRLAVEAPFSLDIKVRKPKDIAWRLDEGDDFIQEIVSKGKVLYEAPHTRVGAKGGKRLSSGGTSRRSNAPSA
jgi:predicted nucleotidyltransferase